MNILIIILYVYPLLGKCRIIDPLYEYEILHTCANWRQHGNTVLTELKCRKL